MKKLLALVLSLAVLLSICALPAMAEDVVTIRVFVPFSQKEDGKLVEDAVNEYILPKLGFKIELVMSSDYYNTIPLKLADTKEQVDLLYNNSGNNYYNFARNGATLDITDLLADYPELYNAVNPALWNGSKVDGRNYGVPVNKEVPQAVAFYAEKCVLDNADIDPESIKSYKDLEAILAECKKLGRHCLHIKVNDFFPTAVMREYGDGMSALEAVIMPYDQAGTFVNYYDTDFYMDYVKTMQSWYEQGYIVENIATAEGNIYNVANEDGSPNDMTGVTYVSYSPLNEINAARYATTGVYVLNTAPVLNTTANCSASVWSIAAKSQYPTQCMEFLQLWNTDPIVKNLLTFGIEGRQFTLNEEGKRVWIVEGWYAYNSQNWQMGNMLISQLEDGEPDDKWEQYAAFNASATDSAHLGFYPDYTEIQDKIAAVKGVIAEYCPLLNVGVLDAEEYVPVLRQALKEAGMEEIVAWYQSQYDAWVAAK